MTFLNQCTPALFQNYLNLMSSFACSFSLALQVLHLVSAFDPSVPAFPHSNLALIIQYFSSGEGEKQRPVNILLITFCFNPLRFWQNKATNLLRLTN